MTVPSSFPSPSAPKRVIIASLTLPYKGSNEKHVHNHPAWLIGLGASNRVFVGLPPDPSTNGHFPADCVAVVSDEMNEGHRQNHYRYCKERLWPVLHSSLWDKPLVDLNYEQLLYDGYRAVNEAFCRTISGILKPGDRLIIIGYHLALLPAMLKGDNQEVQIAFFAKCPVSSSEFMKCLPQASQVLTGLLNSTLVVVQTSNYIRYCVSSCLSILGFEMGTDKQEGGRVRITDDDGKIQVDIASDWLGVDVPRTEGMCTSYNVLEKVNELRRLFDSETIMILGIDGVDQIRGIKHKLVAYKLFLETFPEYVGKVPHWISF
jgi:trehalose 6-phosphate synthase/phosphatase